MSGQDAAHNGNLAEAAKKRRRGERLAKQECRITSRQAPQRETKERTQLPDIRAQGPTTLPLRNPSFRMPRCLLKSRILMLNLLIFWEPAPRGPRNLSPTFLAPTFLKLNLLIKLEPAPRGPRNLSPTFLTPTFLTLSLLILWEPAPLPESSR